MKFYACSQIGIGKSKNEDRMIIGQSVVAGGSFDTDIESGIVAIADGVGGNNAGAVASHFVASRISYGNNVTKELLAQINDELITQSEKVPQYNNMATTLSGIQMFDGKNTMFHIGNSRVCALQSGKYLKQLTEDDTTLNYLIARGQISPEDADGFDRKNEIIACFGGGNSNLFKIKLSLIELLSPVLLTSDGIHDYLCVDEIEDIIEDNGISLITCKKMIEAARQNGSTDDASVIIGGVN